jgi:hypothetical protein
VKPFIDALVIPGNIRLKFYNMFIKLVAKRAGKEEIKRIQAEEMRTKCSFVVTSA